MMPSMSRVSSWTRPAKVRELPRSGAEGLVSKKPRIREAVKLLKINKKSGIGGVACNSGVIR
jgi:hypothetical protein